MTDFPVRRHVPVRVMKPLPVRRGKAVTAKNANPSGSVKCFNCDSHDGVWVAVDVNRYVGSCPKCFDSAVYWAAICTLCESPRYVHGGEARSVCPREAVVNIVAEIKPKIVEEMKAIAAAPEVVDAEEVPLDE